MAAGTRAQKPQRASPRAERPSIDSARAGHRVSRFGEPGRSLSMSSEAEGAGRDRLVPLIVSSALFMQNLDSTVLTTALPTMPITGSSHDQARNLPATSATMAVTEVIASASTCP